MRAALISLSLIPSLLACSGEPIGEQQNELGTITQEIRSNPRHESKPIGAWRTKTFANGAWVDLVWLIGLRHAWHVVTAYADQELTIPLLRWDLLRSYGVDRTVELEEGLTPLLWTDVSGRLLPFVHDPELFAGIGIDDCSLELGASKDLSRDNCGAPLFPFRDCQMMDYVRVEGNQLTFGSPFQGDRCEQRPSEDETWSFERVTMSPELLAEVFAHPWHL